jgi:hypothetical protein
MRGTIVVLLLLYAAATAAAGSRWLPQASWPLRAPRAAIAAWQAATLSVIASVVAAGVILAVPCLRVRTDPAVLRACLSGMWAQHTTPQGALARAACLFLLALDTCPPVISTVSCGKVIARAMCVPGRHMIGAEEPLVAG